MYCSKCGAELREGASFCSRCGSPVKDRHISHNTAAPEKPASQTAPDRLRSTAKAAASRGMKALEKAAVSELKKAVVKTVTASAEPGEMKISLPAIRIKGIYR